MMYKKYLLHSWIILVHVFIWNNVASSVTVQDLSNAGWSASYTSPPDNIVTRIPNVTVPGCAHTDWYKNAGMTKENDPFYRFNDVRLQGIANSDWTYKRSFSIYQNISSRVEQWIIFEGLDTIANISLNGKLLGNAKNMFLRNFFNVTGLLKQKQNLISVSFMSATKYANNTRKSLKYSIPPECPPDVQHGFCHVNLLRKEQCSFSWDWGPGFATQGIWKPVYLIGLDQAFMTDAAVSYDWDAEVMTVEIRYMVTSICKKTSGKIHLFIDELSIHAVHPFSFDEITRTVIFNQSIPLKDVQLWWPNNCGKQKLYNVTVKLETNNKELSTRSIRFGFRKIELIQNKIPGSPGLSFYLKVNDREIFAKGSNWIPADAFATRATKDNYTNLLQSAKDANMNILRVWGGGIYESDDFYDTADRMGIMIWHDFMFACAMYPANGAFLESVSREVLDTIWRLKSHPSIALWAGNNENEAALGTDWYNTTSHFDTYRKDYVALYVDTIGKNVTAFDTSRPYLTSSPTNGVESKEEGWVAKNPYNTHYGDTHYYNYNDDCLDWTKYPKTRFASEYGFQSFSSIETMSSISLPEDLIWDSQFLLHRNHHGDGNAQILNQISKHFKIPDVQSKSKKFEDLVYLSQIMQGLCYKSETEFYRRGRSEIVHGEGHTMGALYWQLNDVWQTTSWSSIEYGGKWKAVHYFAKKFFADVALSAYDDDTSLTVYSLSDIISPIEPATLVIEMHSWDGFDVMRSWETPVYITPESSKMLYQQSTGILLHNGGCNQKEMCYFVIYIREVHSIEPTFFYPVPMKDIIGLQDPSIIVSNIMKLQSKSSSVVIEEYRVSLKTTAPAFFVVVEAIGIKGRFSDNAFHMYNASKTLVFYSWEKTSASKLMSSLAIKSLADTVFAKEEVKVVKSNLMWLDDTETQIAFGIGGVFFILFFAILLVSLVMRLNTPVRPPSTPRSSFSKPLIKHKDDEFGSGDLGGAFLLNVKNGFGHDAKNVEIRFYVQ